jgi:hypothetical protein
VYFIMPILDLDLDDEQGRAIKFTCCVSHRWRTSAVAVDLGAATNPIDALGAAH